ncbi:GNAT family N-acetyltransferase [Algoriphagus mannitolivorans]|uniref:GNAT family N-acetyltransferase n=1 Tax=Algoriphagus mannitolivorans TaxID=226504 RepID=UPI00040732AD|nr:GNAT family N-acetyltransferase [Algoriphagus mannitolivorans]
MITPLPFDSELFGYPVGKYQVSENWNENEFRSKALDYQLVYLFSEKEQEINSPEILQTDIKVVFEKILEPEEKSTEWEIEYQGPLTDELISLAYASGEYSRFKIDPRLKAGEFEKLYRLWITKAWKKGEVLVSGEMEGMVTYSVEKELAQIGLIAVKDSSRGKGLGKGLVNNAESSAREKGAIKMHIPTQKTNLPAMNLYHNMGYEIASQTFVYHYWNPDFNS